MNKTNPKSDFVHLNGIRLHYLDWGGSGPTLIFLTGMGSSAYIFNQFAPRFTDKFRVLALTRRGHGDSDYPETGYDIIHRLVFSRLWYFWDAPSLLLLSRTKIPQLFYRTMCQPMENIHSNMRLR